MSKMNTVKPADRSFACDVMCARWRKEAIHATYVNETNKIHDVHTGCIHNMASIKTMLYSCPDDGWHLHEWLVNHTSQEYNITDQKFFVIWTDPRCYRRTILHTSLHGSLHCFQHDSNCKCRNHCNNTKLSDFLLSVNAWVKEICVEKYFRKKSQMRFMPKVHLNRSRCVK